VVIQAVADFVHAFTEQETRTLVVERSERDTTEYLASMAALAKYCVPGLGLSFAGRRPIKPADPWFESEAQAASELQPRTLFQIEHYRHAAYGDLFRCILSGTDAGADAISCCLYVARVDGDLKVIAKYGTDPQGGWANRGGERIDEPGNLVAVRMFESPARPDTLPRG